MFILGLVIGLFVGGCAGFIFLALFTAAKEADREMERQAKEKEHKFNCKEPGLAECGDTCCRRCLGFELCIYACRLDPKKCGSSVIR